jgi:hypothetical protein
VLNQALEPQLRVFAGNLCQVQRQYVRKTVCIFIFCFFTVGFVSLLFLFWVVVVVCVCVCVWV